MNRQSTGAAYADFIEAKTHEGARTGFAPTFMPDGLFGFQESLVEWSVLQGRAAIFADCGLGKTVMQLAWAENVARHTGLPVLVLTPLAVGPQTVAEGEKFGIECARSRDGSVSGRIVVTNYERIHLFNSADFGGVVCDESSILKNFDGSRRGQITDFMRKVQYRLLATATAAPNDYIELGTSSEALGWLGHMDMLNRFFRNSNNNSTDRRMYGEAPKWRFKGHAETPFWRWVVSWARACRKPSDLGFDDESFVLPPLDERTHIVEASVLADGMLFALPATTLQTQREERRRTLSDRCEKAADLSGGDRPSIAWCHLNDEGDLLEKLIPDAIQVSGKDNDDTREAKLLEFLSGGARVLVTKQRIAGWGLNFQHCSHMTYFPSHSYEQYYQGVRRCWRFGQSREVVVDVVMTEGERAIMDNLKRKSDAAAGMFSRLVGEMNQAQGVSNRQRFVTPAEVPSWL